MPAELQILIALLALIILPLSAAIIVLGLTKQNRQKPLADKKPDAAYATWICYDGKLGIGIERRTAILEWVLTIIGEKECVSGGLSAVSIVNIPILKSDELIIYGKNGEIIFREIIDPDETLTINETGGVKICWTQKNWDPLKWAAFFTANPLTEKHAYRARLIKRQNAS